MALTFKVVPFLECIFLSLKDLLEGVVTYTTQNLIRIKLALLFAEGPAYLIPNIL